MSMAITVYTIGFLYAHLFRTGIAQYYPFLVAGMLSWSLIANIIPELGETFITSDSLLKQIKLPYTLYIHRVVARNIIIFFHNLAVIIPIWLWFPESARVNLQTLFLIPSLFIIYVNAVSVGLILAMIGARYRDMAQVIKSLIQVAFFVTPIMWNPTILPIKYQQFMYFNPFYIFVELIREPLIGFPISWITLSIALTITFVSLFICSTMFVRYRARIIYWL